MTSSIQRQYNRPRVVDLTREYRIGSICFDELNIENSLIFSDIHESVRMGIQDFIFNDKVNFPCVCRVVNLDITTGEVEIQTSENPEKPTVKILPDLIQAEAQNLFHYDGCLVSYGQLKHKEISFGDEIPPNMIGSVVFSAATPGIFASRCRLVAAEIDPGRYVLAALVDFDSNDKHNPLIIRYSANYDIPCRKMALNSSVFWVK